VSRTITISAKGVHEEALIDTTIRPGMNIMPKDDGSGIWEAGQGGTQGSAIRIVKEDALRSLSVDDPYVPDDSGTVLCLYIILRKVDRVNVLLKAGETVQIGDSVGPEVDGLFIAVDAQIGSLIAIEASGPNAEDTLVPARMITSAVYGPFPLFDMLVYVDPSETNLLFEDYLGTIPVTDDYDPIGFETDKTPNTNNATQDTTAKKATHRVSQQNGMNVAHYDGVDDFLFIAKPSQHPLNFNPQLELDDFSIYFVGRRTSLIANQCFVSLQQIGVGGQISGIIFGLLNHDLVIGAGNGSGSDTTISSGILFPAGEFFLVTAIKEADRMTIYKNATQVGESFGNVDPVFYSGSQGLKSQIGMIWDRFIQPDWLFHGDQGPVIVYGHAHDDGDRTAVQTELINTWVTPDGEKTLSTGDGDAVLTGDGDRITIQ